MRVASIMANPRPTHPRGPAPNGNQEQAGRPRSFSGVNRDGSNRSGSGNQRCVVLRQVRAQENLARGRQHVAADRHLFRDFAHEKIKRRIEPHRFSKRLFDRSKSR